MSDLHVTTPPQQDAVTIRISHEPYVHHWGGGWRAQTPGYGTAASFSVWTAINDAIGHWLRNGRPGPGKMLYAPVPANAIGSEAEIARAVYAEHHWKLRTAQWTRFAGSWNGVARIAVARSKAQP